MGKSEDISVKVRKRADNQITATITLTGWPAQNLAYVAWVLRQSRRSPVVSKIGILLESALVKFFGGHV
jgi:hypothetical protein